MSKTASEKTSPRRNSVAMRTLRLELQFLTPGFLGNAEQSGQWRTPPLKAQLRQWWRVAYAADHGFNVKLAAMRREEGLLFGNAWLENEFCKSSVRIRLQRWDHGKMKKTQWPADSTVTHPEVKNKEGKQVPVGSALYLGYGPLELDKDSRKTALKATAAIHPGESARLAISFPSTHRENDELKRLLEANVPRLESALWLMDRYGTLGGRSRNGWGSFALQPLPSSEGLGDGQALPLRLWRDCLDLDWPHAIGKDSNGKPLIWQTVPHADWKSLMKTLAILKIGLRTQFVFPSVRPPHTNVEPRHWLSYPITTHTTRAWDRSARLPNQLRFKVRKAENGKLVGIIFHMPHLPPKAFNPDPYRQAIENVWREVHRFLDAPVQKLARIAE